jgi:Ca2+-binding EF-hand superfamily protein
LETELHEAAYKVAKYYVEMFEYMDKNIDDYIDVSELKEVYEKHHWAKPPELTVEQMCE